MVTFVGGGAVTPLLLELARQGEAASRVVRLGTTTSVAAAEVAELRHFVYDRELDGRLIGAPLDQFDRLLRLGWVEIIGVAADDAAGRSVTVAAPGLPAIPRGTTQVVAVIGADALDAVIEDVAHRPMRVAAVAGCRPYERLTPARAARVLLDERGGRAGVPGMARFSVAVTGVRPADEDTVDRLAAAVHELDAAMAVVRVPFGIGAGAHAPERLGIG
jgi:hypothetical protein